jgi:hypothetical protein
VRRSHKYGNASQVKCWADGGKVKKTLANRGNQIDAAVDKAQTGTPPAKKAPPKKNPYPAGSARAKLWARKEKDKMADGGKVKMKPHVPAKVKSPILERAKKGPGPGGPKTPVAKGTYNPKPVRKR